MNNDINLISPKTTEDIIKQEKALKITRILAGVSLGFVAVSAVIVFILNLTSPLDSIRKQEQVILQNMSAMKDRASNYALLNDRLKSIDDIVSTRKKYDQILDSIVASTPSDISIEGFALQKEGTMSVNASGRSLDSINNFIDNVVSLSSQKKGIKNVVIDNLIASKDGKYGVSITFTTL